MRQIVDNRAVCDGLKMTEQVPFMFLSASRACSFLDLPFYGIMLIYVNIIHEFK